MYLSCICFDILGQFGLFCVDFNFSFTVLPKFCVFQSSDGRVVRSSASGAVDSV